MNIYRFLASVCFILFIVMPVKGLQHDLDAITSASSPDGYSSDSSVTDDTSTVSDETDIDSDLSSPDNDNEPADTDDDLVDNADTLSKDNTSVSTTFDQPDLGNIRYDSVTRSTVKDGESTEMDTITDDDSIVTDSETVDDSNTDTVVIADTTDSTDTLDTTDTTGDTLVVENIFDDDIIITDVYTERDSSDDVVTESVIEDDAIIYDATNDEGTETVIVVTDRTDDTVEDITSTSDESGDVVVVRDSDSIIKEQVMLENRMILAPLDDIDASLPDDAKLFYSEAVENIRSGNYNKALDRLDLVIYYEPGFARAYFLRAVAGFFTSRYRDSMEDAKSAYRRDPERVEYFIVGLLSASRFSHVEQRRVESDLRKSLYGFTTTWDRTLADFFLGQANITKVLARAAEINVDPQAGTCIAYTYVGIREMVRRHDENAKISLDLAISSNRTDLVEFYISRSLFARLQR
jgi:hypothetical protein